jgi:hypothetical protein
MSERKVRRPGDIGDLPVPLLQQMVHRQQTAVVVIHGHGVV